MFELDPQKRIRAGQEKIIIIGPRCFYNLRFEKKVKKSRIEHNLFRVPILIAALS